MLGNECKFVTAHVSETGIFKGMSRPAMNLDNEFLHLNQFMLMIITVQGTYILGTEPKKQL